MCFGKKSNKYTPAVFLFGIESKNTPLILSLFELYILLREIYLSSCIENVIPKIAICSLVKFPKNFKFWNMLNSKNRRKYIQQNLFTFDLNFYTGNLFKVLIL